MSGGVSVVSRSPLDKAPTLIGNYFSATPFTPNGFAFRQPMLTALTGAVTANVLSTVMNLTGPGVLNLLGVEPQDGTARTFRVQLTIDGVIVFDSTSISVSSTAGIIVVGDMTTTVPAVMIFDQVPFYQSAVLKVCSNLTETGKLRASWRHRIC